MASICRSQASPTSGPFHGATLNLLDSVTDTERKLRIFSRGVVRIVEAWWQKRKTIWSPLRQTTIQTPPQCRHLRTGNACISRWVESLRLNRRGCKKGSRGKKETLRRRFTDWCPNLPCLPLPVLTVSYNNEVFHARFKGDTMSLRSTLIQCNQSKGRHFRPSSTQVHQPV